MRRKQPNLHVVPRWALKRALQCLHALWRKECTLRAYSRSWWFNLGFYIFLNEGLHEQTDFMVILSVAQHRKLCRLEILRRRICALFAAFFQFLLSWQLHVVRSICDEMLLLRTTSLSQTCNKMTSQGAFCTALPVAYFSMTKHELVVDREPISCTDLFLVIQPQQGISYEFQFSCQSVMTWKLLDSLLFTCKLLDSLLLLASYSTVCSY